VAQVPGTNVAAAAIPDCAALLPGDERPCARSVVLGQKQRSATRVPGYPKSAGQHCHSN